MTKQEARDTEKKLRKSMNPGDRDSQNKAIRKNLFDTTLWKEADWLYTFVSFGTEVDTLEIIKQAFLAGKNVAVPRVNGKIMDFYEIKSLEELKPGLWGILEPVTNHRVVPDMALMVMPGLAFDKQKNRVGYGGGFYDKYLELHGDKVTTVAPAYDFQVVDAIEAQRHDLKPEYIVTPNKVW